jgi:hypothetical protein
MSDNDVIANFDPPTEPAFASDERTLLLDFLD